MAFDFPASPAEGASYSPAGGPRYVYTSGVWRSTGMVATGTAEARNRIVNGAMQISQENPKGVAYGGADTYEADQWQTSWTSGGTPNHGCFQDTANADVDWYNRLNSTVADTSIAAADFFRTRQIIEGIRIADFKWGTANAKQVVLRFKARSSILGTFGVSVGTFSA